MHTSGLSREHVRHLRTGVLQKADRAWPLPRQHHVSAEHAALPVRMPGEVHAGRKARPHRLEVRHTQKREVSYRAARVEGEADAGSRGNREGNCLNMEFTKTSHAEYLASETWQKRRRAFLENTERVCNRCGLPRWLSIVAYDQDLHVVHTNFARLDGEERDDDLKPLCRSCHEQERNGMSSFHQPGKVQCFCCNLNPTFDIIGGLCDFCRSVIHKPNYEAIWRCFQQMTYPRPQRPEESEIILNQFKIILRAAIWAYGTDKTLEMLADIEKLGS